MNLKKKFLAAVLTLAMALSVTIPSLATATEETKTLDILFMHDMHSYLNPVTAMQDGEAVQVGGLSRMMTLVKQQYAKNPETLFLDAGDYSMGTVVQSVFETDAVELRALGAMGVDALTLGNHEYDFGPDGLARSLMTAKNSGEKLPAIVVSNIDMEATKAQAPSEKRDALLATFENYGVEEYIMLEKSGVKIAVMGIFGLDAVDCAPFSELIFKDPVEGARETVDKILANEDADMIVCVSHSGTSSDPEISEDELIAKSVPEIDVIISGHTHTMLSKAIVHGTTYIGSADQYSRFLGSMSLTQNADGTWKLDKYELIPITEDIPEDEAMQATIDNYLAQIDVNYLSVYGFERTEVLAENDVEFCPAESLGHKHEERNLGSIMADSYRYYVESLPDWDGKPVHVAAVPKGLVRGTYPMGNITVEDVFNSFSLGIGEDGMAGYPLVSVYFTGAEIKLIAEIDASISPLMNYARLSTSGLQWTFNPNRLILSKAYDAHLVTLDGERTEIENDELYRVVADLYSLKLLSSVTDLSYGLLSIVPKDAEGNVIENFSDTIIHTEGREVKAWEAIARYMQSFEDTDGNGIANVDSRYASHEGRKVVEDSKKLGDLLKQPNKFFFWIAGIVLVVVFLLVLIPVSIIRGVKKRKARKLTEKKERLRNKI